MIDKITLILILHNRHRNIDRLLDYYNDFNFPIIIADSSSDKHHFDQVKENWQYSYTPGIFFTEKLEIVLNKVATPYVLMCADDDFIIPESILQCVAFLESNIDYAIAQGLSIRYEKESVKSGKVEYGAIYKNSNSVEDKEPLERLSAFFKSYRSIFYAVYRTVVLQQSFSGAGKLVNKLFLNEYITGFLPILYGKYKEIPVLYQVREYAQDSDDKTAIDIDTLLRERQYDNEVDIFKTFIASKMAGLLSISTETANDIVNNIIYDFAGRLYEGRMKISLKKRIGILLVNLPLIGAWMIKRNRTAENKSRLKAYIDIKAENKAIETVSKSLIKFG